MAKKLEPTEEVSLEEAITSTIYTQEALINVIVAKGLFPREELLEEIRTLYREHSEVASESQNSFAPLPLPSPLVALRKSSSPACTNRVAKV